MKVEGYSLTMKSLLQRHNTYSKNYFFYAKTKRSMYQGPRMNKSQYAYDNCRVSSF